MKCFVGCAKCYDKNTCELCETFPTKLFLHDSKTKCKTSCPQGFFEDSENLPMCINCPSHCLKCKTTSDCLKCREGYKIGSNNQCKPIKNFAFSLRSKPKTRNRYYIKFTDKV